MTDLAKDFGKKKDEKYYALSPIHPDALQLAVNQALQIHDENTKQQEKQKIEAEIAKLQNKLKEYE